MASFMSSSCFETGAELLRCVVFGFDVWESVCAKTLVAINTTSAEANLRFISSPERQQLGGMNLQQNGSALTLDTTGNLLGTISGILSCRSYKFMNRA